MSRLSFVEILIAMLLPWMGSVKSSVGSNDFEDFRNPPSRARLRMFWRVFGPAWTRPEIDYELSLIKESGVGGLTVFFMYPVALDDAAKAIHNQRFLSPEFLETFAYAARRARGLGLEFSVAGSTGWPFGGSTVTVADSAQQLRRVVLAAEQGGIWQLPALKEGETYLAGFQGLRDVTKFIEGGRLQVADASGLPPVEVFIAGPTRMNVKRAAFGAEGLVVDHLNHASVERYLESVLAPMVRSGPVRSIFCDSLEVYGENWTGDFLKQFQKRRHYNLEPLLPELFEEHSELAPDLRFDFWRTQAELAETEFVRTASSWAHRHKVDFEMEAYGTPPTPLSAARFIDEPVGEQYEWKGFSLSRLAASGAHLAGKRVIGAEAWTWLGIPNRLADSLSDLKLASDLHFLAGLNDLIGVDFVYSPRSVGAPGWLPYYGPALNQNNPQWPWFRLLADYTSRCQWLLRQGKPVAEVAVYLPVEDKFAQGPTDQMLLGFQLRDHFVSGEKTDEFGLAAALRHHSNLIHGLLTHGFNYDGIDFFSIARLARVHRGRLVAGDGDYRILVLPNVVGLDLEAMEKVAEFCRAGGTVIATRRLPDRCHGFKDRQNTKRLQALVAEMFGISDVSTNHARGLGRGIFVADEQGSLTQVLATLSPDLLMDPYQPEVGFVHRRDGKRDIYFMVNVGQTERAFTGRFPLAGRSASLWDPKDGTIQLAEGVGRDGTSISVPLKLSARGSIFVVLDSRLIQAPARPAEERGQVIEPIIDWTLSFAGSNAPPSRSIRELITWTSWPENEFYSGEATYSGVFRWDQALPRRAVLVFSQVHEVCSVQVNGVDAGSVWTPPYEVDLTSLIHPGTNILSVRVANLPLNRFLAAPDEDLKSLQAVFGARFPAPSEKRLSRPAPSGLIGPVRLRVSY